MISSSGVVEVFFIIKKNILAEVHGAHLPVDHQWTLRNDAFVETQVNFGSTRYFFDELGLRARGTPPSPFFLVFFFLLLGLFIWIPGVLARSLGRRRLQVLRKIDGWTQEHTRALHIVQI